jgi:hypothetical protein
VRPFEPQDTEVPHVVVGVVSNLQYDVSCCVALAQPAAPQLLQLKTWPSLVLNDSSMQVPATLVVQAV